MNPTRPTLRCLIEAEQHERNPAGCRNLPAGKSVVVRLLLSIDRRENGAAALETVRTATDYSQHVWLCIMLTGLCCGQRCVVHGAVTAWACTAGRAGEGVSRQGRCWD